MSSLPNAISEKVSEKVKSLHEMAACDKNKNCAYPTTVCAVVSINMNRQISYRQYLKRHSLSDSYKVHGGLSADYFFAL
jgi:hypothetical protein